NLQAHKRPQFGRTVRIDASYVTLFSVAAPFVHVLFQLFDFHHLAAQAATSACSHRLCSEFAQQTLTESHSTRIVRPRALPARPEIRTAAAPSPLGTARGKRCRRRSGRETPPPACLRAPSSGRA